MAFTLDHWNNPRATIANVYEKNDFAYVTHGASIALYVLERLDIKPSEAKEMTILDYGCGTGRAALFMSKIFGKVVGYDPNLYCISEAAIENKKANQNPSNLIYTHRIGDVPVCDLAYSSNVIEHLLEKEAKEMIDTLAEKVKGRTLLWYSPANNGVLSSYVEPKEWASRVNAVKDGKRIQVDFFDFKPSN